MPKSSRSFFNSPLFYIMIFILALLCALIWVLPSILSSEWGKNQFTAILNQKVSGHLSIKHLDTSWFGGQKIQGLKLTDEQGQNLLTLEEFTTDSTLLDLFIHGLRKGRKNTISSLEAKFPQSEGQFNYIKNVNGEFNLPQSSAESFKIKLAGDTVAGDITGKFSVNIDLSHLSLDELQEIVNNRESLHKIDELGDIQLSIQGENIPVDLLEVLAAKFNPSFEGLWKEMLGKTIDFHVNQKLTHSEIILEVKAKSQTINANLTGRLEAGQFNLVQPGKITFLITPQFFQKLKSLNHVASPIQLANTTQLELVIEKLDLPITVLPSSQKPLDIQWEHLLANAQVHLKQLSFNNQDLGDSLSLTGIKGSIQSLTTAGAALLVEIDQLDFSPSGKSSVGLKDISANLNGQNLAKEMNFKFQAMESSSGTIKMDGVIKRLLNSKGSFNFSDASFAMRTNLQKIPVSLVAPFVPSNPSLPLKIEALFGPQLNGDVEFELQNMNGPIIAQIDGQNGKLFFDALISNGIMSLKKNFTAEFALTPKFGTYIFDGIFPLFSHIISAENPLIITIDAKNFSLPLKNFNLSKVVIDQASLSMGKILFANKGQLGQILSILNVGEKKGIPVWFTPLYLSMHEGVIKMERLDMQILEDYPLATWGTVSLVRDRVNLIIGLTGHTMAKAFGIRGIDQNTMLQVPLTGTLTNASIDKKSVVAKISALVAQNHGTKGKILGTVLHIAGGGLNEEKVPPPSTNPLPWDTSDSSNSEDVKTNDLEEMINDPSKELEKGAKKLLKNIFNS